MRISQNGLDLIKKYEGFRPEAYLCTSGIPTIGYGSTYVNKIKVKLGDTITLAKAEVQLLDDVTAFEKLVNNNVTTQMTQGMFDALVSIVYNVGPGLKGHKDGIITLKSGDQSTLLRKVNTPDKIGASLEFLKWTRSAGIVLKGLVRRRTEERELFLS